jgi:solute:Na+ symporter, SSS family
MSFSLGLIDWAICLVVLSSTILFCPAVRKKSSADSPRFFLADRSLPWPLLGASLFATNIGAEHLVESLG